MSTITDKTPLPTLDEPAWVTLCDTESKQATKGSGCSHGYYVDRFSLAIDAQVSRLPEHQRAQALQIAKDWDYATPAERQEAQEWNAANGCCTHGIDLGCCPAGYGSY